MKKTILIAVAAFAIAAVALFGSKYVLAEQSGSSPESGATSYIKATYDSIVALGHGSVAAGAWGDWGSYWNRIRSAAEWVPNGTAGTGDVLTSKTFFPNSRSSQTGTYDNSNLVGTNIRSGTTYGVGQTGTMVASGPCSTQVAHDDAAGTNETINCSKTWADPGDSVTGTDLRSGRGGQDPVTGLIWSNLLKRNGTVIEFSPTTNTTFSWDASHANNIGITAPVAGNRTAVQLCADQGNGWRLPTQKELMQAYIDGSYWNLTQPSNNFWSATVYSATNAWYVALNNGYTDATYKSTARQLRCVR